MTAAIIILSVLLSAALTALFIIMKSSRRSSAEATEWHFRHDSLLERARLEQQALQEKVSAEADHFSKTMAAEREAADNRLADERERREVSEKNVTVLSERLNIANAELSAAKEKLRLIEEDRAKIDLEYEKRFSELASKIMKDNSKIMSEEHTRRLSDLITPFQTKFEEFRNDFRESYQKESRERFSLIDQIKQLNDTSLNIGKEARRLTDALKGNTKVQGEWGEMILENILELSGLEKGRDYFLQETATDSEGKRLRPDALIRMPGNKCIVIDSKVSLTAYMDMLNSDDSETVRRAGEAHLLSVKNHIAELAKKNYQDFIGEDKLDFVIMFVPGEGAYTAAMTLDPAIWEKAFNQRVIMISPTNLTITLRLIQQIWSKEKSTANALAITEEASKMLEKFTAFTEDLDKVDKSLANARKSFDEACGKLKNGRGNLISRTGKLKALGVKAKKNFPDSFRSLPESISDDTDSLGKE